MLRAVLDKPLKQQQLYGHLPLISQTTQEMREKHGL